MKLSQATAGAVLALSLLVAPASAAERGLFGIFGSKPAPQAQAAAPPVQMAQANDPRVSQLEEQMRQMSGTIEELNFQVLQMQEQMRKQQEDIEFRLQELEGGGAAKAPQKRGDTAPATGPVAGAAEPRTGRVGAAPALGPKASADDQPAGPATAGASLGAPVAATAPAAGGAVASIDPSRGTASQPLGTITFDKSGAVTGGSVGDQTVISRGADLDAAPADGTAVAALPRADDPEESYRNAYEFILSGDYRTAEAGFRDHIARFPHDARAADAQFWLGESLLGQEKYRDAAEVFLSANKSYPKSRKAPDMLFKLGVSLAGLNQHDVACATFSEVEKRYPTMSAALKDRVRQEKTATSC